MKTSKNQTKMENTKTTFAVPGTESGDSIPNSPKSVAPFAPAQPPAQQTETAFVRYMNMAISANQNTGIDD